MEAFTKQMKTNKGSPSTWTANTVKQLGTMVKGLSPKELKQLANAGAATFEARYLLFSVCIYYRKQTN
jgi:hypothetical protein